MPQPDSQPDFYSQFGEDRVLAEIYRDRPRGVCVEVGANDGYHGSTTLHFEKLGWDCVLVEPNPELCEKLRRERKAQVFECAVSSQNGTATLQMATGEGLAHAVSTICDGPEAEKMLRFHGVESRPVEVRMRRLDDLLAEAGHEKVDFMSIDVEGHELEVLRGFSPERWGTEILIIENNRLLGGGEVKKHLQAVGYVRFLKTGVNDWFTPRSNTPLASRAQGLPYRLSVFKGNAMLLRAHLTRFAKKIPGVEPAYRALRKLV